MRLIRHIHPIGQGAFYTEQFLDAAGNVIANIAYDCGSGKTASKGFKTYVKKYAEQISDIDILFISHFDADHINGISTLIEAKINIKRVVIPLMDLTTQLFYSCSSTNKHINSLFLNPNSFFHENTKII